MGIVTELENKVVNAALCTNCGACQGLCPYWLSYEGRTVSFFGCSRDEGRCAAFCPRLPTDLRKLRDQFFDDKTFIPELGPFLGLYLTQAKDPALRKNGQHGGTTGALVELALREGFIDAAVLTKSAGGTEPEGILATTAGMARECQGSCFQIPPTLKTLNEALNENVYKKIGIVGTACKTAAVYKMKTAPCEEHKSDAEKIGMVFGLFCGWGLDWNGLRSLVERHTSSPRHIDILPSRFQKMVIRDNHSEIDVGLEEIYPLVRESCTYCTDMTAEFSDVSIGGARSGDGWDVDKGWNQTIVRTKKGMELLETAKKKGALSIKDAPKENLQNLINASMRKKSAGVKNLIKMSGDKEDLVYLDANDPVLKAARN